MSELSEFRTKRNKIKTKNKEEIIKLEEKISKLPENVLVLTKKELHLMSDNEKHFLETHCDRKIKLNKCTLFYFDDYNNPVILHKAN